MSDDRPTIVVETLRAIISTLTPEQAREAAALVRTLGDLREAEHDYRAADFCSRLGEALDEMAGRAARSRWHVR